MRRKIAQLEKTNLKVNTREWVGHNFGGEDSNKNQKVEKPKEMVKDKTEKEDQVSEAEDKHRKQDEEKSKELVVANY